jgi:hypothetical protein
MISIPEDEDHVATMEEGMITVDSMIDAVKNDISMTKRGSMMTAVGMEARMITKK